MKSIVLLTFLIFPLIMFGQLRIEIPICDPEQDVDGNSLTVEKKKALFTVVKRIGIPNEFYESQVSVFVLNHGIENIITQMNSLMSSFNFKNTYDEAKSECEKSGLNISHFNVLNRSCESLYDPTLLGYKLIDSERKKAISRGDKYIVIISQDLGLYEGARDRNGVPTSIKEGVYVKILNLSKEEEVFICQLKQLSDSEFVNKSNFKIKEGGNNPFENATYNILTDLPVNISKSKVYFIQNPLFVLSEEKPIGSLCKKKMWKFQTLQKDYASKNIETKKSFLKSNLKIEILDKESDITESELTYIFKYYEYMHYAYDLGSQAYEQSIRKRFYLENSLTKEIYVFKSRTSMDYSKYLSRVIDELNGN